MEWKILSLKAYTYVCTYLYMNVFYACPLMKMANITVIPQFKFQFLLQLLFLFWILSSIKRKGSTSVVKAKGVLYEDCTFLFPLLVE